MYSSNRTAVIELLIRLTGEMPFKTSGSLVQILRNIKTAPIAWNLLDRFEITGHGQSLYSRRSGAIVDVLQLEFRASGMEFVRGLIQRRPKRRLALSDAQNHPWLRDCVAISQESPRSLSNHQPA